MKSIIYILTIILFFIGCNQVKENKIGQTGRINNSFNQGWYFTIDSINRGEFDFWNLPENIPLDTIQIKVPHTWNVIEGMESYFGTGWYFKFFNILDSWESKIVRLRFNAIYRDAKIWLNGNLIFNRVGTGYTPFEIDISKFLFFSEKNFISIKVSNDFSKMAVPYENKFDWPADGGLIRSIEILKTDPPSIGDVQVLPEAGPRNNGVIHIKLGILGHKESDLSDLDVWV